MIRAGSLPYGHSLMPSEPVKDVTSLMSSKEDQTKSPTDTTSAEIAAPRWSLGEWLNESRIPEVNMVKCTECKVPTLTEWIKVTPQPLFTTDDMIEVVSKSRRLTMCTVCGLVKTIT